MNNKFRLLALILISLSLSSCNEKGAGKSGFSDPAVDSDPTAGIATEKLFVIDQEDSDADVVWLFEQGGPKGELFPNDLVDGSGEIFPNPDVEELVSKFQKPDSLILARVHQALTYSHDFYQENFTAKEAKVLNDFNALALHRVIMHFKSEGKTVWVFGHSYGCYTIMYYFFKKGPQYADKFIPMACRLDMETLVSEGWSRGEFWVYDPDSNFEPALNDKQPTSNSDIVELKSAGYIFEKRFTQLLNGIDLSNVIFVVGTVDSSTGLLTQSEKDFLSNHSAELIEIADGDHGSMFARPLLGKRKN